MNWITGGDFFKNLEKTPYDKLFHLRIDITTSKGVISLEKNEVINMDEKPKSVKQSEIKEVSGIPKGITTIKLLENAKKKMGSKFFPYSASSNNCQDFIMAVLTSNNLGTQNDYDFVKQNTDVLFKTNPFLKSIADKLTGLGARVDVILQGGSIGINHRYGRILDRDIINAEVLNRDIGEILLPEHLGELVRIWRAYFRFMQNHNRERLQDDALEEININERIAPDFEEGEAGFSSAEEESWNLLTVLYESFRDGINFMLQNEQNVILRHFPTISEAIDFLFPNGDLNQDVPDEDLMSHFNPPLRRQALFQDEPDVQPARTPPASPRPNFTTMSPKGEGLRTKKISQHNIQMNGKGSEAMKDKMAKLRAMRGSGMSGCGDAPNQNKKRPLQFPAFGLSPPPKIQPPPPLPDFTQKPPEGLIKPIARKPQGKGMKGSQEMKDKMARLREMRSKK
jgi:hypothetical protein